MGNDDLQSIFSVGCQGHTRFQSKILVLDSFKFSYFGPPTSIELKNHMKFMWNSRVVKIVAVNPSWLIPSIWYYGPGELVQNTGLYW